MKIAVIIFLSCLFTASVVGAGQDIALPKIEAKIGMDVLQAMESRAASRSFSEEVRNVAFLSAGSAAQNMYVAGAVYKIQMLTQVSISNKAIKKGLNLPKDVEPLTILSFGYSE